MRMDKLTGAFQAALADAQSLAVGRDNQFIEPAHLLLAMLEAQGGSVRPLLVSVPDSKCFIRSSAKARSRRSRAQAPMRARKSGSSGTARSGSRLPWPNCRSWNESRHERYERCGQRQR